ncbi:MAG: VWA domain-containing protein [Solobacterium sp.]|nr:VWA domain-containing protein [Solobacterium sp.]
MDADGNVIKTFTVDGETQDYCDISETISVATSTTDHFNTYTATSGTIYDLVFEIEGHTYNSTYLTSYTSATSHGDRINAEAFRYSNGSWGYTNYGGDASTSANDHSEDIHSFGTITDVYVVYDKKTTNPDDPSGGGDDEELDAPTTGKTVEDNDDGTSTLSLSIAGSSKDISKNIGANVIVIFDRSGSMNATRLTEAKTAARTVATELLGLNGTTPGDDPLVEMLLIAFGGSASPSATETGTWYSIAGPNNDQQTTTGFNGAVNAIGNQQGTNWEIALQSALAQAQSHLAVEAQRSGRSDPDSPDYERVDDTYIIFITDGQPSMKVGDTRYHTESTTATFYTQSNYVRATDEARSIVEAGYNLYSIGIYGTIEVLHYLTDFALTGRSTYDSSKSGSNNANGHYFTASNYSALATALSTIADTITGKLAVAGVSFTDGIATSVTSTNISGSNASGFKYTVKNGSGALIYEVAIDNSNNATFKFGPGSDYNGETFTVASNASGTAGTGSNGTAYTATAESVTTSFDWTSPDGTQTGTKTSTNMVYTVKIGDTEYKMSPASVDANGEVQWDLAGVGTIDSGYVWTVSFIVWPDQDAYDIVTDLNNGIETDYKWIDFDSSLDPSTECAREQRDTNGNLLYYYDGVFVKNDSGEWVKSQYTHIVKYPGTSTYAALTNTHQDVQYFIYDEDTGTYIGPVNHEIAPPDPISLDAALATVQKKWEVDLDKEQLIYALFNTWTGESNELKVEMHVFEDHEGDDYDFADQYTQTTLGWQSDISAYDWADDPEDIEQIELYGRTYTIGTLWEDDLSIAVGVMIDEDKAEEYGLTDNAYAVINGKKYYVLEHGHDYDIVESGFQNYRFDYISHTYHPMLVDGDMYDLQNLRIGGTDEDGKQYYVFDSVEPMTALVAHNTLRGGINISKSVIDGDEEPYDTDTNFTFEITLDNPTEDVFVDDSIPWYAVTNGKTYNDGSPIYFYYHDADGNLYQASGVEHDGEIATFTLYDEEGNAYPATSTEFAEKAGPADITYTKDGEEITIALYGNALTVSDGNKKASATLTIPATDVIRIANVPYKTTYTINEVDVTGFDLVEIKQTIQPSEDAPASQKTITTLTNDVVEDVEIEAMKVRADSKLIGIVDEIVPNNQNNIGFTNQTTSEAFYVYHSSDNKVEKILFADTRVNNEYANDQIVYQFNIANETKAGSLYGGYYQSYAGAVATDDQITGKAAEGKLVYAEGTSETMYDGTHTGGMWADDAEGAKSYDYAYVKAVKAGTEDGWDSDYYTAKGTEMSPEKDTVYYLKEVPDHYDLPYTHYTYNKGDKLLRNMWYITATDDLKYGEVGFVIKLTNENGDVATIVDTLTVQNATGGTTVKLTPKSIFGGNATTKPVQGGYLGYTDETSRIEANTTSVFTPYWKTMDGVTVRGLTTRTINFNNGKVGTGGMLITNADTAAALLLADINTGN